MYIAIFFTVGLLIANLSSDTHVSFEQKKLSIVVFDEDNTAESKALYQYLAERHEIVEEENDKEKLWDDLYYHSVSYVLTINEGYSEKMKKGECDGVLSYSVDPQSYECEYLNMQLRQYVSTIGTYMKSGMDFEKAQIEAIKTIDNSAEVTPVNFSVQNEVASETKYIMFMRYLAYVMPAIMITVLSRVIITLRGELIRSRTLCSPLTPFQYNGQIIMSSTLFCTGIWLFINVFVLIVCGMPPISSGMLLGILNSFVFMLVSAGIGILVSMCFSNNSFAIDMIANIVCLGMSFLCGVFVDQSLLGENVLKVGQFLPSYWYVCAINNIGQANGAVFNAEYIWQCMGTESLFAVALFVISMAIAKFKKS